MWGFNPLNPPYQGDFEKNKEKQHFEKIVVRIKMGTVQKVRNTVKQYLKVQKNNPWRGGRVVDGTGLENRHTKVSWVRIPPSPPF